MGLFIKERGDNINRKKVLDLIKELEQKKQVLEATNDVIFKGLMQDENMKDFVSFLISSVDGQDKKKILDEMVFVNTEVANKSIGDKINIHDILIDINGNRVSLEMNNTNDKKLEIRNLSHFFVGALNTINLSYIDGEEKYFEQIHFDNVDIRGDFISMYRSLNVKTGEVDKYEKNFVKYRINMVKAFNKYYNCGKEGLTRFEKAIVIMMLKNIKELRELSKGDEMLMKVEKKIEQMSKNPDIVGYLDEEKIREFGHMLDVKEAREEGISEGEKKTAKKMIDKGMAIQDIVDVTGLTVQEIEKLK